jgi:hypothetical protein
MRVVWRAALVLAVFVFVGLLAEHGVMAHAGSAGNAEAEVRLSAIMAGLFAGGLAAVIAGIAVWWPRR